MVPMECLAMVIEEAPLGGQTRALGGGLIPLRKFCGNSKAHTHRPQNNHLAHLQNRYSAHEPVAASATEVERIRRREMEE
jgi:hypothetical protein